MMKVDRARCTGCEICSFMCPAGAIEVTRKAEIDPGYCLQCGTCMVSCPSNAISTLQYPTKTVSEEGNLAGEVGMGNEDVRSEM